ncbi:MAG: hypothetical protein KDE09_23680 [Anaerolineales bacterium]|nr:hypothetical protein [Anaerolineales bacterium]
MATARDLPQTPLTQPPPPAALPSWRTLNWDTSPEAEAVLFRLWREAPAWRKLEMMGGLNQTARQMALIGLRQRSPQASDQELQRRLADILLGPALAGRVYGPVPRRLGQQRPMQQSEAIQVTLLITQLLDALAVPYVIGGALASTVHGMVRATLGVDILADLPAQQVAEIVAGLNGEFYVDEMAIRQAIINRRSFNLIHLSTMFKVDIFIPQGRSFDEQQLKRRVAEAVDPEGSSRIWVLSAEDIILAKLDWFRQGGGLSERQWRDVLGVLKLQGTALDFAYLHHWAKSLGVADLLEQALFKLDDS